MTTTEPKKQAASGIAGRTNYSKWDQTTNKLLDNLKAEEAHEEEESNQALGKNKYSISQAQEDERQKADKIQESKKMLDSYKAREGRLVQVLSNVLSDDPDTKSPSSSSSTKGPTKFITRNDLEAGKRVLTVSNTTGPGHIILTQDLSHLECALPSNSVLTPKSHPQDVENDVDESKQGSKTIHGLIKLHLTHLSNVTVTMKCKVLTGLVEISHCDNVTIKFIGGTTPQELLSTVVTVQADLCSNLSLEFHNVPSGKQYTSGLNLPSSNVMAGMGMAGALANMKNMYYWGDDSDDRIFHAGVSNLKVSVFKDDILEYETKCDYEGLGAKAVGNASAEEVQFVTSIIDGELLTERVLRDGNATGTTVSGVAGDANGSGGSARAMTAREMKEVERKRNQVRQNMESTFQNSVKIVDKDGKEVAPSTNASTPTLSNDGVSDENDQEVEEEIYAGMTQSQIDSIIKDCEQQKAKGNEAFVAGEYAQAVLLYTLTLDRAAELPDVNTTTDKIISKTTTSEPLFPRHVVLSNRSASFLKLGHFEKALADGTEAERLDPTYVKGIFRKGLAYHAMGQYSNAIQSLASALKIEPKNKQIKQALQFAEVRMQQEHRKRMEGI